MNATLFKREIKANYVIILIFMAVLTMYSSMIVAMYDPKLGESLNLMAQSMPQLFAAFGMLEAGSTLIDFIVNYLYGFLFVVLPAVFILLLSNKLMARYIDRGSMAYLLATPNKRSKIAFTQAVFMVLSTLLLVIYVTVLCIIISHSLFPGDLDIPKFLIVNIGLFGLLFFLSGICFCASCVCSEAKLANGIGAGLVIAFVLIQMISQVGDKFENLKYATPLTLFNTDGILAGESKSIWMFIILYAVGLIFYSTGIIVFQKRDLSL